MKLLAIFLLLPVLSQAGFVNESARGPVWKIVTVKNNEPEVTQNAKDILPFKGGSFCLFGSATKRESSVGILECYSATEDKKRSVVKCAKPGLLRRDAGSNQAPDMLEVKAGDDSYLVGVYCQ